MRLLFPPKSSKEVFNVQGACHPPITYIMDHRQDFRIITWQPQIESAYKLEIERGRYTISKTAVENRICKQCNCEAVEDEEHLFIKCNKYSFARNTVVTHLRTMNYTKYKHVVCHVKRKGKTGLIKLTLKENKLKYNI